MVRPFGSVNRDRFKRLPFFSLKTTSFHLFFPPLYGVVWSIHLTLKQKSIEITLKPSPHSLNHSQISITLCLFLTFSVSITLSSLPLSLIAVAAQPRSLPHSLNHSLISTSLPRRRCSSFSASLPLPSFGTLLPLICFFFVKICKLIVDDDIDLKCWCVN